MLWPLSVVLVANTNGRLAIPALAGLLVFVTSACRECRIRGPGLEAVAMWSNVRMFKIPVKQNKINQNSSYFITAFILFYFILDVRTSARKNAKIILAQHLLYFN